MEEADELCDRVALMHHGTLRALGRPADLKAALGAGASLDDVFRAYSDDHLDTEGSLRDVRSTRRTIGRVG
jgi:ABC-2 type transport system ATP-binding protein